MEPMSLSRDAWPSEKIVYRLMLTYTAMLTEAGKYRPTVPMLNG